MSLFSSIDAYELDPRAGEVRVRVARESAPALSPAAESEWSRQKRRNDRLHDGPILSVVSFDPGLNEIAARRDGYARLVVQPRVQTGVRQLSVTAVLIAHDGGRNGRAYALMGRRSPGTRIYGGLWELGPSGGLPAPAPCIDTLTAADLHRHLADEIAEEAGLTVRTQGVPVAYIRDRVAHSDDVVLRYTLGELREAAATPANWEYSEVVWMPIDCAAAWDNEDTIAATRALFRVLGWIDVT